MRKSLLSIALLAGMGIQGHPALAVTPSEDDEGPAASEGDSSAGQEEDGENPGDRRFVRPRPRRVEVAPSLGGVQVVGSIAMGVLTLAATLGAVSQNPRHPWLVAGGIMAGGAVATGLVTCAIGQTRGADSRCTSSVVGALIGATAAIPGLWMLHSSNEPCTESGPNADDKSSIGGVFDGLAAGMLIGAGYIGGTVAGSRIGWAQGAPPSGTAALNVQATLLSVAF